MNYKITSIAVLTLAAGTAGFILLSKTSDFSLTAPITSVGKDDIEKFDLADINDPNTASAKTAETIAQSIIEANPNGPQQDPANPEAVRIKAVDPNLMAENILQTQVKKATEEMLAIEADPKDIRISNDATVAQYLLDRDKILKNAQKGLTNLGANIFDESSLGALYRAGEQVLSQVRLLPVPSSIATLHAEQIRLLLIQQKIFKDILNRDIDPIAATVSVSLIDQLSKDTINLEAYFNALAKNS